MYVNNFYFISTQKKNNSIIIRHLDVVVDCDGYMTQYQLSKNASLNLFFFLLFYIRNYYYIWVSLSLYSINIVFVVIILHVKKFTQFIFFFLVSFETISSSLLSFSYSHSKFFIAIFHHHQLNSAVAHFMKLNPK